MIVPSDVDTINEIANRFLTPLLAGVSGEALQALSKTFAPIIMNALNAADYVLDGDGDDLAPALERARELVRSGTVFPRAIRIPAHATTWNISRQVLFDLSDFTLFLDGNVQQTSTTVQKALLFAFDNNAQPAQQLKNVTVIATPGVWVDGNGSAMTFDYATEAPHSPAVVRANYVDNFSVIGIWARNGAIDCIALRQCRNSLVRRCVGSGAKYDNGITLTTDMLNYTYGNPSTYGYGLVEDCTTYGNAGFGQTAFNVSGVWFRGGISYANKSGYSYEDSFSTPDVKRYDGGFLDCHAYNCPEYGFYGTGDGITIDDNCTSWNIRGYAGDNSNNLYEHGVALANARWCKVGGDHRKNGRSGLYFSGGTGLSLDCIVTGKFNDNDYAGIYGRGIDRLSLSDTVECHRNGKVLVNGVYAPGLLVLNSGGSNYNQDAGVLKVRGASMDGNGLGAIDVQYVKTVDIQGVIGLDNCQSGVSAGIRVRNASVAKTIANHLPTTTGNQQYAVLMDTSVLRSYYADNSGDGTIAVVLSTAATFAQSVHGEFSVNATWAPGTVVALSGSTPGVATTTVTVQGATAGDLVACYMPGKGSLRLEGEVTSSNIVTVTLTNFTTAGIAVASGTLRVVVTKRNAG